MADPIVLDEERRRRTLEAALAGRAPGASYSDGDGGDNSMNERVSRLETHMEYVRKDLDEIKALLKVLPSLATKRDLDVWRWQWIATGVAIIGLTVGGIIGGLSWIKPDPIPVAAAPAASPASPQPIIIQIPAAK